jgi:hypothetical protein
MKVLELQLSEQTTSRLQEAAKRLGISRAVVDPEYRGEACSNRERIPSIG